MFRGIEIILQGRDPRDAPLFVQRSCGVCTYTHYLSSMRAVEDAVGVTIPKNARIMRNLLHGAQFQQDHITHFYQLHALDFVDVVDALKADPKKTAALSDNVSNDPHGGTAYLQAGAATHQDICGQRSAGSFCQRLLGKPRLPAAAGSQPDGGGPLYRSPSDSSKNCSHACHFRGKESPSPRHWPWGV
jgi:[NiFe] hydrogenase large subunit